MPFNAGAIVGTISLNTTAASAAAARFASGLRTQMTTLGREMSSFAGNLGVGLGAPILAAAGALYKLASGTADYAERLRNLSQATGLTRQQLQELEFICQQNQISFEAVSRASVFLQRSLMGVELETGNAGKVLEALGITVHNSDGSLRAMSELFPQVISRLQGMTNETQRNMFATQVFGRGLKEIAPLLGMSADEMERSAAMARSLGVVMSEETLKAADRLDTGLDLLHAQWVAMSRAIQVKVVPALNQIGPMFLVIGKHTIKASQAVGQMIDSFGKLPERTQLILMGIAGALAAIGSATLLNRFTGIFSGLWAATSILIGWLGRLVLFLPTVGAAIATFVGNAVTYFGVFAAGGATLGETILAVFGGIPGIIAAALIAIGVAIATNLFGIRDAIVSAFNFVKPMLSDMWRQIKDTSAEIWSQIKTTWTEIASQIKSAMAEIWAVIGPYWPQIKEIISVACQAMLFVTKLNWTAILTTISGALTIILGVVKVGFAEMRLIYGSALDLLVTTFRVAMLVLRGDWGKAWAELRGLVGREVQRIGEFLSSVTSAFTTAGANLMWALVRGMASVAGQPAKVMAESVARGLDKINQALGFGSVIGKIQPQLGVLGSLAGSTAAKLRGLAAEAGKPLAVAGAKGGKRGGFLGEIAELFGTLKGLPERYRKELAQARADWNALMATGGKGGGGTLPDLAGKGGGKETKAAKEEKDAIKEVLDEKRRAITQIAELDGWSNAQQIQSLNALLNDYYAWFKAHPEEERDVLIEIKKLRDADTSDMVKNLTEQQAAVMDGVDEVGKAFEERAALDDKAKQELAERVSLALSDWKLLFDSGLLTLDAYIANLRTAADATEDWRQQLQLGMEIQNLWASAVETYLAEMKEQWKELNVPLEEQLAYLQWLQAAYAAWGDEGVLAAQRVGSAVKETKAEIEQQIIPIRTMKEVWADAIDATKSAWQQFFEDIGNGIINFGNLIKSVFQSIVSSLASELATLVTGWIKTQLGMMAGNLAAKAATASVVDTASAEITGVVVAGSAAKASVGGMMKAAMGQIALALAAAYVVGEIINGLFGGPEPKIPRGPETYGTLVQDVRPPSYERVPDVGLILASGASSRSGVGAASGGIGGSARPTTINIQSGAIQLSVDNLSDAGIQRLAGRLWDELDNVIGRSDGRISLAQGVA